MSDLTTHGTRVAISGSFRKHWNQIEGARKEFTEEGARVLSPVNGPPELEKEGFAFLRADVGSPAELEARHLSAIQRSDLLYVVNPAGYLGSSVALEIGYALAWDVPIWSSEPFTESPHSELVRSGTIGDALRAIGLPPISLPEDEGDSRLESLQAYIKRMAHERGFEGETPEQVLILLMEEVGELAKAMRARMGLAMSVADDSAKSVRLELADCFIYLLHLANQSGVNLLSAFREKERLNATKKWYVPRHDAST